MAVFRRSIWKPLLLLVLLLALSGVLLFAVMVLIPRVFDYVPSATTEHGVSLRCFAAATGAFRITKIGTVKNP